MGAAKSVTCLDLFGSPKNTWAVKRDLTQPLGSDTVTMTIESTIAYSQMVVGLKCVKSTRIF
jgi:hypothetical protein